MKINYINTYQAKSNSRSNTNFGIGLSMSTEAIIYPNTNQQFHLETINNIDKYPTKFKNLLQNSGYKVVITPSLSDVTYMQGIKMPNVREYEDTFPKDTLGTIMHSKSSSKKYIIFCDKKPYSYLFNKNIVNNALSGALAEALNLYKNENLLLAIEEDICDINQLGKINTLRENEKELLANELIDPYNQIKIREVIPDLIAWNIDAGKFGSGLYGVYNSDFLPKLFPVSNRWIQRNLTSLR